ncbi:hypothetical protein PoB_004060900 [Plakobranchus ocellatus]|uniref:Uncharacterized protein n=1 Tax=Plakobranchus ocellatus TaxID=259542 RepID=A0AAV4B259_9GAST|nr:hypothetical protein PoB_004060900 [Plakobranchus ocellatus]
MQSQPTIARLGPAKYCHRTTGSNIESSRGASVTTCSFQSSKINSPQVRKSTIILQSVTLRKYYVGYFIEISYSKICVAVSEVNKNLFKTLRGPKCNVLGDAIVLFGVINCLGSSE